MAYFIEQKINNHLKRFELQNRGVKDKLNYAIDVITNLAKAYISNHYEIGDVSFSVIDTTNDITLYKIILG